MPTEKLLAPQGGAPSLVPDGIHDREGGLLMHPSPIEILATVFFALAVLHTFMVKRFRPLGAPVSQGVVQGEPAAFPGGDRSGVRPLGGRACSSALAAMQGSVHAGGRSTSKASTSPSRNSFSSSWWWRPRGRWCSLAETIISADRPRCCPCRKAWPFTSRPCLSGRCWDPSSPNPPP